jgi:hypothetical protein
MKRTFHLHVSDNLPRATVPNKWIWDLVEYLSILRTRATYSYSAQQFVVSFPCMNLNQARELLEDWAGARDHADRPAAGRELSARSSGTRELAGHTA